ncbi:hypothetical protein TsFJ059_000367 [Trichoderma semiorbis]|uniref:Uncharacterized protein n=1 Tax=Trichoderma semiorbis TaxID=1491008 RepID=A0A9P8KX19_9HYPO|nr:hypothetical protein TsFJ059_000367 [Trichoderma semiorbis]
MKSFILAATAVTAVAGRSLLELGLDVDLSKTVDIGLGLSVHLPQGINEQAVTENKPTSGPPAGYVNIWHPSHGNVVMDGCDDESSHDWHWVHPCGDNCNPNQADHVWSVSTVSVTSIHTVISCAPTVTNCPANGHHTTTIVIPETTTFCPVEASKTAHPSGGPSTGAYPPAASSAAPSAPVATNTAVVTLSTQTVPAPTGTAGYPAPSNPAPANGGSSVPPVVPSAPASAPVYPVPGNSSVPLYTAPSTSVFTPPTQSSPAGCSGDNCSPSAPSAPAAPPANSAPPTAPSFPADGCSGAYCAPPPAGTAPGTAAPVPTGNSTTPLPINGAVSRTRGVGMALFGGVIAALFL